MRIVHVITRLIIGGAQENTLISCQGQHDAGHEVTLITGPPLGPEGSLIDRARNGGYRVEIMNDLRRAILPATDFRAFTRLTQRLIELHPDVVHTHSSKAGIVARWAADRARVPFIVHTIHGLAFTASTNPLANAVYKWLERETAPLTDKIVCVAGAMRDQSLAAHIGWPSKYVTIYSGMETAPFINPPIAREITRRKLGLKDDHIAVGTIARLFHLKGHDDLLAISRALCAQHPNLRFLWVGDGLLRKKFESRISAMGLRDRFILTGLVPPEQVPELVAAMDIVAHPSRREGLARALPQGSLAGKPTVTYDIDGAKEGVLHEQTGFVLPPFDRSMMAAAIHRLAADPDLRQRMGQAGRAFALARFDSKVMIAALERLYRDGVPSAG